MGKILTGHLSIFIKCERLGDQKQLETEPKEHPVLAHQLLESKERGPQDSQEGPPRVVSGRGAMRPSSLQFKDT